MFNSSIKKILFGGDYNPEQWPENIWSEDMRLFKLAGIDTVTLNVFSWAELQPSENEYNFSKLDKIINLACENNMKIILATSTAAHPAWMARKYPEILRVTSNGEQRKFGSRHNSCPNSPIYQKYSVKLAEELANRYGENPSVIAWHISNEYGDTCYCEKCQDSFRQWLKSKYKTIDAVNEAWNTSFWGHTYYDFEDIVSPNNLSEHWGNNRTTAQGESIDYKRFKSILLKKEIENFSLYL